MFFFFGIIVVEKAYDETEKGKLNFLHNKAKQKKIKIARQKENVQLPHY